MSKFRKKKNDTIPRKYPEERTERLDRPYFIGPFQLLLGVQKGNMIFDFAINLYEKLKIYAFLPLAMKMGH